MPEAQASYLLIIGERKALAWVLAEERMAFPPGRTTEAQRLQVNDRLLLYTTRGCFHNPGRDRGRVMGTARVESPVVMLDEPLLLSGREFTSGCAIEVEALAPLHQGVELAPLVARLQAFPDPQSWTAYMRRPLLRLPTADARRIERELRPRLQRPDAVIDEYRTAARLAA